VSRIRVCFLGTPQFAVTSLKALLDDEHFEVVGVVTQPDRPSGRKLQLTPSPVKVLAQSHRIQVLAPESLRKNQLIVEQIRTWRAEVAIVVAFGQILTEEFMQMFNYGAVNVHGSLLPRWRGAAPIQRALEAGDKESGVTLQKMVKKLDAGDMLGIRKVSLDQNINAQELHDQLALLGAELLKVELMDFIRGNLAATPQEESLVTLAKKIDKAEAEILWSLSAESIHNKVRAFVMGPGTYTMWAGKKLKIHRTEVEKSSMAHSSSDGGVIKKINLDSIEVQTGGGVLKIFEVQPESRSRMSVADFLKGQNLKVGDRFEK
jgi:methionyl-tRNA formyltransferase